MCFWGALDYTVDPMDEQIRSSTCILGVQKSDTWYSTETIWVYRHVVYITLILTQKK